jgi:parallel beta-helix repeat protein/predicted outer membrane repeat protein
MMMTTNHLKHPLRRVTKGARISKGGGRRTQFNLHRLEDRTVPATITVTNNLDDTATGNGVSLREAILSTEYGANINSDVVATGTYGSDTINFDYSLAGTTITLDPSLGQFKVQGDLTINGPSGGITIDARRSSRVFYFGDTTLVSVAPGNVALSNLTIVDGMANGSEFGGADGGGILSVFRNLTLTNCVVSSCSATGDGGGISFQSVGGLDSSAPATLSAASCTVTANTADGNGGGVSTAAPTTIAASDVENNSASGNGGGICSTNATVAVLNSMVTGNTAVHYGGGVYAGSTYAGANSVTLGGCTVTGNRAGAAGGVAVAYDQATIGGSVISTNTSSNNGAGVWLADCTAALSDSTISYNKAAAAGVHPVPSNGGGIFAEVSSLALTGCQVSSNTANGNGAGIYSYYGGSLELTDCTVSNNSGTGVAAYLTSPVIPSFGGGIFAINCHAIDVAGSTVSGNTANGAGGGILSANCGWLNITSSKVSSNTADASGGGIDSSYSDVNLSDATITTNHAGTNGGGIAMLGLFTNTLSVSDSSITSNVTTLDGGGIWGSSIKVTVLNTSTITLRASNIMTR